MNEKVNLDYKNVGFLLKSSNTNIDKNKEISNILESIRYFYLGNKNEDIIITIFSDDVINISSKLKNDLSYKFKVEDINNINNYELSFLFKFKDISSSTLLDEDNNKELLIFENNKNDISYIFPFNINEDDFKILKEVVEKVKALSTKEIDSINRGTSSNEFKIKHLILSNSNEEEIGNNLNNYFKKEHSLDEYEGVIKLKDFFNNDSNLLIVNKLTLETILETYKVFYLYVNNASKNKSKSLGEYFSKMAVTFNKTKTVELNENFFDLSISFKEDYLTINLMKNLEISSLIYIYKLIIQKF